MVLKTFFWMSCQDKNVFWIFAVTLLYFHINNTTCVLNSWVILFNSTCIRENFPWSRSSVSPPVLWHILLSASVIRFHYYGCWFLLISPSGFWELFGLFSKEAGFTWNYMLFAITWATWWITTVTHVAWQRLQHVFWNEYRVQEKDMQTHTLLKQHIRKNLLESSCR